jgi:mRNA-degrading endonuclease YafQ of YafQ-DinJ toxin-antitoxin module
LAVQAFRLFLQNPNHPSLRNHALADTDKGQHRSGSRSVSITMQYRAIYTVDGDTNVWYWIGSHNDYENFVGKK